MFGNKTQKYAKMCNPSGIKKLSELMNNKNDKVKLEIIEALGTVSNNESSSLLCSYIRYENPEIRTAVAKSLAKTGNSQSETHVRQQIASESDEKIKAELQSALDAIKARRK